MNKFSDFDIKTENRPFTGDKIKIDRILNKEITVEQYKIENSKFEGKGKCLHIQIQVEGEQRIVFSGSKTLMEQIEKVPQSGFPFAATIIKDNERLLFT